MGERKAVTKRVLWAGVATCTILLFAVGIAANGFSDADDDRDFGRRRPERLVHENARRMIEQGRHTFRYDTFGDEAFWGGKLKLHQAIAGAKQGGVGPGV